MSDTSEPECRGGCILVVEDNPVARRAIGALVAAENDLRVCNEVSSAAEALACLEAGDRPDVVLVDIALANGDVRGLELVEELRRRYPGSRTLVVSSRPRASFIERARRAGACGYVEKHDLLERLLPAVRAVLAGGTAFDD